MQIKLNFKTSLIAFSTLLVGLAVAISSAISYQKTEQLLIDKINHQMKTVLVNQSSDFEQEIVNLSEGVSELAQLIENRSSEQSLKNMVTVAAKLMNANSVVIGFDNDTFFSSEKADKSAASTGEITREPWFKSASQSEQVVVSNPFISTSSGRTVFTVSKRFSDGIVIATMDINLLKKMVDQAAAAVTFAILIESDGTAIYSNNPVVVPGENTKSFAPPMYQAVMKHQDLFEFKQTYANEAELVIMKQLQVGDKTWYLANGALERKIYAQLAPVRTNAIVTTLISIVIAVTFMLLLLRVLYRPLLVLRTTLSELAKGKGDLTQRLTVVNKNDDLGIITEHINNWIKNNQNMMQDIHELSQSLGLVIDQVSTATSQNISALNKHVNQTEMVVSAIEELNATSKGVTQNALSASKLAESANATGIDSKEIVGHAQKNLMLLISDVRETAENVQAMSLKTENISAMTEVIGNVADQTNLLALNAAIEAARAGEHGRGFAVVAEEVRNLASRTQSNTTEIDNAVNGLLQSSSAIVSKMETTSKAGETASKEAAMVTESLNNLTDFISDMDNITSLIATAADEQTNVTEEVTKNVFEISEMAGQVNNNIQQSSKNIEAMAAMYSQLSAMVSAFKIS